MSDETTGNPFYLTLGAAARQAGVSKSTLSRAIKDGKLSGMRSPDTNSYRVDPSELARYCEAVRIVRDTVANPAVEQPTTGFPTAETPLATQVALIEAQKACELAEARLADLRTLMDAQIAGLKTMLDEARADRDRWAAQAERLALPGPRPERRGLWRWLKRAG